MEIIDPKARKYCQCVIKIIKKHFKDEIDSVILFGSHSRNQATILSDVDLLIILNNSFESKTIIKRLSSILMHVEQEILVQNQNGSSKFLKLLLTAIKNGTGMFKSWFITSKKDFLLINFSKVFSTNYILSKLFAPSNDIFYNIKQDGIVLYGNNDILNQLKISKISNNRHVRPFIMNFIIAICALILRPIDKEMNLFSYEALKWSIYSYNSVHKPNKNKKLKLEKQYTHPLFSVIVPIFIIKIYKRTYSKMT